MSRFIDEADRSQGTLLPETIDEYVCEENPVRVIDAFVVALDLGSLGFEGVEPEATGRASVRDDQGLDGRHALLVSTATQGERRDEPARSGVQPEASAEDHGNRTLDRGAARLIGDPDLVWRVADRPQTRLGDRLRGELSHSLGRTQSSPSDSERPEGGVLRLRKADITSYQPKADP